MTGTLNTTSVNRKKLSQRISKENNRYKQFPLLNLYMLALMILQVTGEAIGSFFLWLIKPIPIFMMIVYISGKNSQRGHLVPTLIKAGLCLSLLADLTLMIDEISAFMIGITIFLVVHVLYGIGLSMGSPVRDISFSTNLGIKLLSVCLVGLCCFNLHYSWNLMPNRFLFTLNSLALLMMNIFAINRYQYTTQYSYYFMAVGAFLLTFSNHLLIMMKFSKLESQMGHAATMLMYFSAQYLLMHGAMHHSNLQYKIDMYMKRNGSQIAPIKIQSANARTKREEYRWEGNSDDRYD